MRIVLDIETNLAHDQIWLCVTKDIETGEVRKWKHPNGLNDYLSKATTLVGHNLISFDAVILNRIWKTKIRLKNVFDTLIVSRLLDPSRENGHSLEAWGKTLGFPKIDYLKVWQWLGDTEHTCPECNGAGKKFWHSDEEGDAYVLQEEDCKHCEGSGSIFTQGRSEKYRGESFDVPHDRLLDDYCVRDVEVTAKLYQHLTTEIEQKQFSQESVDLEHRVAAIIAKQTRNGFKLDQPYAMCLITSLKTRLAELLERSSELYPEETVERYSEKTGKRLKDSVVAFNLGSRQQIATKLKELGWRPSKYTEKGSIIVDEAVLDEIIKEQKCKIEKSTKNNGG